MPKLLEIRQLGDPILRQKAICVNNIADPLIQELIDDMLHTCKESGGMGLAANQVGENWSIMIVASKPNERYPHAPLMEPTVMINPRFAGWDNHVKQEFGWEGCLSIPGRRGYVGRASNIMMHFRDRHNAPHWAQSFEGFVARIIQHEWDHLDGKVFLDRVMPHEIITEEEFQKLVKEGKA